MSGKKQRDTAAADAEIRAKREQQKEAGGGVNTAEDAGPTDILAQQEDEDVIF